MRNKLTVYSFILTVFVIWLHAGESLISSIPGQIAVPGFFMLSGFLFFRDFGAFAQETKMASAESSDPEAQVPEDGKTAYIIGRKLGRRVRTLLIPYLCWNLIYYLIYLAAGKAELSDFLPAVFLYRFNPVFWYIRQLMLVTLLSPLLWLLLKKTYRTVLFAVLVFLAAVFWAKIPFHYCNEDALFYYFLGAVYARYGRKAANGGWKIPELAVSAFGLLLGVFLERVLPGAVVNTGVLLLRASGAALLWFLTEGIPESRADRMVFPFMKINFFTYATHYLVIRAVWALETALRLNGSAFWNILTYLSMPVFCVAFSYAVYRVMKKIMPRVLSVLTGGRGETAGKGGISDVGC